MNILEYEMLDLLKSLKEDHGVFEIKAEYENEGSRQTELMRLKDLTLICIKVPPNRSFSS